MVFPLGSGWAIWLYSAEQMLSDVEGFEDLVSS